MKKGNDLIQGVTCAGHRFFLKNKLIFFLRFLLFSNGDRGEINIFYQFE